ncbi:hypothetical protein K488DRAFT_51137 [Vararia minispora EC-137]|uniref:Uncharacterized protein n=1 Tax=Vararia minispora EC-137 TaxID=1314806 RepID=A0ACB8QJ65_9AGAM|nr:hypothetical protein K488DRAFT_51137 [Vararia minispora EC-137]
MPFRQYFQPDDDRRPSTDDALASYPAEAQYHPPVGAQPTNALDSAYQLPFQVPSFVFGGPPTLAPGGGAEVLPATFISAGSSSWFAPGPLPTSQKLLGSSPIQPFNPHEAVVQAIQSLAAYPASNPSPTSATRSDPPSPAYPVQSQPFSWSEPPEQQQQQQQQPLHASASHLPYAAPSALGLPVYSSTGFDLLSVLARVVTRPNPKIMLGPVDMSCSFCVVDVRRYDHPIIYASPTFYRLTGYEEHEVIGRNCRFLQSPDGHVARGERRQFVAQDAVEYLKKSLVADKECQTSIINYRKDGSAFSNLVTVIPVTGGVGGTPEEQDQVAYHVGFQVDLTKQPNAILSNLRDGTYMVNYSSQSSISGPSPLSARDRKNRAYSLSISQDMLDMLNDSPFLSSILPATAGMSEDALTSWADGNHPLSLALLSTIADSVLVLSLKGCFLYVAPAIAGILGYDPMDLVDRSLTDFCHQSDIVPLTRELKESSVPTSSVDAHAAAAALAEAAIPSPRAPLHGAPRPVNLLFRARTASGDYVWLECRGRLHIEPGKGRKAILLSARPRAMPRLPWNIVPAAPTRADGDPGRATEVWGMLSRSGTLVTAGQGVRDVLGWPLAGAVGKTLVELAGEDPQTRVALEGAVQRAAQGTSVGPETVNVRVRTPNGGAFADASVVIYPLPGDAAPHAPLIVQFCVPGASSGPLRPAERDDVFEEMAAGQDSGWQFTLQQLKIENQRLTDKIQALERDVADAPQQQQGMMPATSIMLQSPVGGHLHEWGMPQGVPLVNPPLKRPWGGGGSGIN